MKKVFVRRRETDVTDRNPESDDDSRFTVRHRSQSWDIRYQAYR